MTDPRDWHMAIGALAGALAASGHKLAHSALRRDETCIRGMLSERVLRDHWPAAIVAEASKRIDEANNRALRAESKCVIEIGKYHDRIASLKRTRAMRINPVDPRRPA